MHEAADSSLNNLRSGTKGGQKETEATLFYMSLMYLTSIYCKLVSLSQ